MKMTMADGTVFEGSMAEYAELLAFAKAQQAEELKVGAPETDEPTKYKEGDNVRIIGESISGMTEYIGKLGKVSAPIDHEGDIRVAIEDELRYFKPQSLELLAVVEASKPELKSGDFVRFEKDRLGITANKIYEIVDNKTYGLGVVDDNDMFDVGHKRGHKYEILSAEEVAEHRESDKWAKIGRKKNEAKVGDIFRVTNSPCALPNGTLFNVTRVSGDIIDDDSPNRLSYRVGTHAELVAPVESLV